MLWLHRFIGVIQIVFIILMLIRSQHPVMCFRGNWCSPGWQHRQSGAWKETTQPTDWHSLDHRISTAVTSRNTCGSAFSLFDAKPTHHWKLNYCTLIQKGYFRSSTNFCFDTLFTIRRHLPFTGDDRLICRNAYERKRFGLPVEPTLIGESCVMSNKTLVLLWLSRKSEVLSL